jgi:RimJ/RimL family protein N-acetyltransferase
MFPDLTCDDVFRLETPGLWLRWPKHADLAAIIRIAQEQRFKAAMASLAQPSPFGQGEKAVLEARLANACGDGLHLVITPKSHPNRVIGFASVTALRDRLPGLTCWVEEAASHHGYEQEAAQALVDAVFTYTREALIIALCDEERAFPWNLVGKQGLPVQPAMVHQAAHEASFSSLTPYKVERSRWASVKPAADIWV